jgi:predicted glycoside hydrolase/deacetylase ChbG (UPF0249 family)
MKLIVNADDFGYSDGVNLGIIEAHRSGIVTSTSAMVTMPSIDHAVGIARFHPRLAIGLHLNITCGKPLASVPSLTKKGGLFYKPKDKPDESLFKKEEIKQEFQAQYNEFIRKFGKPPSHLDTHLYAHQVYRTVGEAIREFALEKKLPVRGMIIDGFPPIPFLPWFKVGKFETKEALFRRFEARIRDLAALEYAEMMVHPAFLDAFLMKNSSYNRERLIELKVLTSARIKNLLAIHRIELTNYTEARYVED